MYFEVQIISRNSVSFGGFVVFLDRYRATFLLLVARAVLRAGQLILPASSILLSVSYIICSESEPTALSELVLVFHIGYFRDCCNYDHSPPKAGYGRDQEVYGSSTCPSLEDEGLPRQCPR